MKTKLTFIISCFFLITESHYLPLFSQTVREVVEVGQAEEGEQADTIIYSFPGKAVEEGFGIKRDKRNLKKDNSERKADSGDNEDSDVKTNFRFSGQASGWLHATPDIDRKFWLGGRYIPQINYEINIPDNHKIDFEGSANIYGDIGFRKFNNSHADGYIDPYRLWVRYSSAHTEVRLGLQKINFGPARMFRPLMWFDSTDPRDPLQMTNGVWGGLFRYYFNNNANIWFWTLVGNEDLKGWEVAKTTGTNRPEIGGRIQYPLSFGEIAVSYHHRKASFDFFMPNIPPGTDRTKALENRIGFDIRADLVVNLWLEASWTHYNKNLDFLTNQQIITLGTDYTFDIGNGLAVTAEHLLYGSDRKAFEFKDALNFTGITLSYPITMVDNIDTIIYYDWKNKKVYTFANWKKEYNQLTFYLMAYWNPKRYDMPGQALNSRFVGKGIQLMVVWNH